MSTGQISLGIIIFYLVAMLVITICNGRKKKQKSAEGFFLANRGVSSVLLPLTMIAAMQSTFAFLGAPGMYYTHGIPYIVMVLSQVWVALMVVYFGNKIRILAKKKGYASCISVLMTMVFLSMQYVGNARAMSIVSGNAISYTAAIIVSILFSLMYVLIGGAGGVVLLDAIQAIILMVGIVLAAWIAIAPVGGIKELFTGIINQAPEMLSRPGAQGLYTDKYWIMQFLVLPFGIWFCPHIWSKSLMAKDEDAIAKSAISIPVSQILIYGFATLFIGLAGHLLATPEQVGAADNILPVLMLLHSNWLVAALVMAAAIAAGISTINAMLLVSSQIVSQDLVLLNHKGKISDKQNMLLSRGIVLAIAVACGIMALDPPETLVQIVQDVAYTGLAQLAPAFLLGLYWKGCTKAGASCGMTAGIIILFATRILKVTPLGWPGFMWAFFTNILLTIVISAITKQKVGEV